MTLIELREKLRRELQKRIAAGLITQTKLATDSKVRQPTISHFLKKADISWSTANALMTALGIRIEDLLDTPVPFTKAGKGQLVPLVKQLTAAITPVIALNQVEQWTDVLISSLGPLPVTLMGDRLFWTRFVAIDATEDQIKFMRPSLRPGARLIIDRHYQGAHLNRGNRLAMYKGRAAIYLIAGADPLRIGFLQLRGSRLEILWPNFGTEEVRKRDIVGRVCEVIVRSRV